MVTLGPLQTRDLVSDTEKVLPVFQVHQVQLGSFSAPGLISVHEHEQVVIHSLFVIRHNWTGPPGPPIAIALGVGTQVFVSF